MSGQPGRLTTRPLVWAADRQLLFINAVIQPGGFLQVTRSLARSHTRMRAHLDTRTCTQVGVANATTGEMIRGLEPGNSTVADVPRGQCVADGDLPFDSTRAPVHWSEVACTHAHTHPRTHARMHAYAHTHARTLTNQHEHTHTHTHTHTHAVTQATLRAVAGEAVRLHFVMAAASLYSFWFSDTKCGASGGFIGAGGPGTAAGRDMSGGC